MFSNINKSAFGTTSTAPTFGFGSTPTANQASFGQTQFFGKANTGGFGQTAPLFGTTPQQNPGTLFSNPAIPSFGAAPQQTGFGTGLFGQQQNVGVSSGTNGLFTSSATPSFGQQNKAPSFGFGTSTSTLFGQQQPQNFQAGTSSGVFGSPGFGGTTQMGTVIKFNPATGTDTMQKGGVAHSINTKHHCITCMKEYEAKSLEELRWEDYQANRKGPQQQPGFGAPFGAPVSTAPSLFGQTDTKTAFGQTSTFGPGTSGFNMTNQPAQPSLFGKTNTGFGATPTTNTFSFNSTPGFGASNIGKGFGTQPNQNVFGAPATTQPSTAFGTNLFQNTTQNAGLFNKSAAQPPFSSQQSLFNFNQQPTNQTSLFQTPKSTIGFGNFGSTNTATPAFGQQNTLFTSQANQNPFNMQKPPQPAFGQPLQTGFGLGTQAGNNSFFGATKPLFGGTTQSSFFNPPNTGFMMNQQQPTLNQSAGFDLQPSQDFHAHVEQIYDPFPHYEFLLEPIKGKTHNTTDPKMLKEILDQAPMPLTNIEKNMSKYRTLIKPRQVSLSHPSSKYALLDDVTLKPSSVNNIPFKISTGKRLILRKTAPRTDKEMLEAYKSMTESSDNKNKSLFRNLQQLHEIDEKCDVLEQTKISAEHNTPDDLNPGIKRNESIFHTQFYNDLLSTDNTPVRDKVDKPKTKHLSLSSSDLDANTDSFAQLKTPELIQNSISTSPTNEIRRGILQLDDTSPKGMSNKTVRFQDNEVTSSSDCGDSVNIVNISDLENTDASVTDNSKTLTNLTCGVILTHPECYTKPPLNELYKFKNDKGECIVKGFTIGRTGYGSVYFPDEIDLSNLNLDEIVQFCYREITVYPDDSKKPLLGEGLNRRAQVTLENVWPRDKITNETIRDVKEISKTNFIDRLCLLAERQNASFLDYRPDTGSWMFTVEHFSKYRYSDVGDSECDDILNKNKAMHYQRLKDLENEQALEREEEEYLTRGLGGTQSFEMDGLASSPIYTLFSHSPDMSPLKDETKPVFIVKSSFFDEDSISDDVSSCEMDVNLSLHTSSTTTSSMSDKINFSCSNEFVKHYSLMSKIDRPLRVSLNDPNFINNADIALFKGRSFKVGWIRGFKFIKISPKFASSSESDCSNHLLITDVGKDVLGKTHAMQLEDHLKVVLNSTAFSADKTGLPLYTLENGWRTLVQHQNIAKKQSEGNPDAYVKYYSEIWNLCLALWGPEAVTSVAKRELFSSWLETTIKPFSSELNVFSSNQKDIVNQLFSLLLSHQVSRASQLAMKKDMPVLSVLIAQTQTSTRNHLKAQIQQWQEKGSIHFMNDSLKKLYILLGGLPFIPDINIFDGLDWKQIIALYLWYICPPGVSLDNAVEEYSNAFDTLNIANTPSVKHSLLITEMAYDSQYHLLKLNQKPTTALNKILNPACHTRYTSDYRLSWLLLQTLTALKIGTLPTGTCNALHIRFAIQLEELGLWQWSVFVVLFVPERRLRYRAIISILERNLEKNCNPEIENFLIQDLKIPPHFIHKVLAQKMKNTNKYIETYKHCILSGNWWDANELAILHVIPELILNRQFETLLNLIEVLTPHAKGDVAWNANVSLILEFLNMWNKLEYIAEDTEDSNEIKRLKLDIKSNIISLANRIKHYPATTLKQSLAVAELSRYIKIVNSLFYSTDFCNNLPIAEQELLMPGDFGFISKHSTAILNLS